MYELWNWKNTNGLIHFLSVFDEWKMEKVTAKIQYLSSNSNAALIAAGIQGTMDYAWDRNGLPAGGPPVVCQSYESYAFKPIQFSQGMNYPMYTSMSPLGYNESYTWMVCDAGVPKGEAPDLLYFDPTLLL